MTLNRGVYAPKRDGDLFVGYLKAPAVDRRFLFAAAPAIVATSAGLSWLVASNLSDPGAGAWETGAVHEIEGLLVTKPYPMVRIADPAAPFGMRTVLVVAQGKCTSALKLARDEGAPVRARGVLIHRKDRRMLEVPLALNKWLERVDGKPDTMLANPPKERVGMLTLSGQIMDSKCFFGVMRPSRGKTHKACASLCIRGGIPPSFWVRDRSGRESVLLMTDSNGGALGESILPLVADPVVATGEVVRVGDILQFRADASAYARIT